MQPYHYTIARQEILITHMVTVQSQADLHKKCDECLHSRALFSKNLFGGYATPRKHTVFSRLALNSYIILVLFKLYTKGKSYAEYSKYY